MKWPCISTGRDAAAHILCDLIVLWPSTMSLTGDHIPKILEELKFGIGDGNLQYYLYNWRCKDMQPSDVGLVLL